LPEATELLIGLWLRDLSQAECLKVIGSWRGKLTAERPANDNLSPRVLIAMERAVALLDATCDTCVKACPLRAIIRPAPLPLAARPASLVGIAG
jgi:hypothetical protein